MGISNKNFTVATIVAKGKVIHNSVVITTENGSFVFSKEFGLLPVNL